MATIPSSIIGQSDPARSRTPIVSLSPSKEGTLPDDTDGQEEQELPELEGSGVEGEIEEEDAGVDKDGDGDGDGDGHGGEAGGVGLPILSLGANGENEGNEKDVGKAVIPDSEAVSSLSSSPSRSLRKDEDVEMRDVGDIERATARLKDGEARRCVDIDADVDLDGGNHEVVNKLAITEDGLEGMAIEKEERVPMPASKAKGVTSNSTSDNEDGKEAPNDASKTTKDYSTMYLDEPIPAPRTTGKDASISSSYVSKIQGTVIEQQGPLPPQDEVKGTDIGTNVSSKLMGALSTGKSQSKNAQEDKTTSPHSQPEEIHLNPPRREREGLSGDGSPKNKDVLYAELKAMKIASLQARNTSLLSEIASKREKLEAVSKELEHPAAETLWRIPLPKDAGTRNVAGELVSQLSCDTHFNQDIFHKFRANGFNAISVYFFWSYHSPAEGVYDFETSGKNVQRLFDYAKEAGLYIIARAGPYCNAETNGGGLALWGSDGSMGSLRTSDSTYQAAWLPWVTKIGEILAKNEITQGGPVIMNQVENELQETTHTADNTLVLYMEQLEAAFRAAGVTVPFSSNEKGQRSISWSTDYEDVGGAVNMYGLDSYPGGLSCTNPNTGFSVVRNYYQWFANYSYTQPNYFPEFEGGYFTPWGGSFYDDCTAEHEPKFADLYYKNNIGQRATLMSLYMTWGGTNWGYSAAPVVYTSYDYSAPLRETRQIQDKLYQTKLIGLFTRVSTDLLKTYMEGNGTGYSVSSTEAWSWVLRNPDTNAGFYTLQQDNSPSTASITFDVYLKTSVGNITVPNVSLDGHQSKILVTDYNFGTKTLLYSSADILTYGIFDVEVLALYLESGQVGQFAFKNTKNLSYEVYGPTNFTYISSNGTQAFIYTQGVGQTTVKFSNGVLVYLLDIPSAWKFWAPPTTTNPDVKPDEQIFVLGPYLVRSANISHGVVNISGDNDNAITIEVYTGNSDVETIDWNGIRLPAFKTSYGSVTASIPGAEDRAISLPPLKDWHSADSLPEISPSYDDSKWTTCNKTTTLSPVPPLTLPVLFSSDYGYYTGAKIYRGYFDNLNFTSVNITASGGLAFGWSAFLNGVSIGGDIGNASLSTTNAVLTLPPSVLKPSKNVITLIIDYHGHDETSTAKGVENPRGILGASLLPSPSSSAGFTLWKIQGNAGGDRNLDPVRGPMNEGGLYGERLGWHLPSSPLINSSVSPTPLPSFSTTSSPLTGLNATGIAFYSTTFHLHLDPDLDVPLGISLSAPAGTVARVLVWWNGYMYAKYVPHIGPQTKFPVPPGVVNNRGLNTLVLALWAQSEVGASLDEVELFSYGKYQTGFAFNSDWRVLQPGWDEGRTEWGW
ncbi:hypothetical protein B7494_g1102 [Chlorociboria aeruginascens]|nr:hypothetical protein B7494_g1102 [Chlorociboria aeruginascens]